MGQKAKSYVGPLLWNNLKKTLNTSNGLNAFTDYIKQQEKIVFTHYSPV